MAAREEGGGMPTTRTRVTVGLGAHGEPDHLRRTIPSIAQQSWQGDLDLVVVDDASSDATRDVLQELAARYALRVVTHDAGAGRAACVRTVLRHARGDYLAWAEPGDVWSPRRLELQVERLLAAERQAPSVDVICVSAFRRVIPGGGSAVVVAVPKLGDDPLRSLLEGTLIADLGGSLVRTQVLRVSGGLDDRLVRWQDHDLFVRLLAAGVVVVSASSLPLRTVFVEPSAHAADRLTAERRAVRRGQRALLRRYEPELRARVLREQDREVARSRRAGGYRTAAWLLERRAQLRGRGNRVRHRAGRKVRQASRRVLPTPLRRWLVRVVRGPGHAPGDGPTPEPVVTTTRDADVRSLGELDPAKRRLREEDVAGSIELLEHVVDTGDRPAAAALLLLEEVYRRDGRMHSAEALLERAVRLYPDDDALRLRRLELLPLRGRSKECVQQWASLSASTREAASALTFARVARAHRHLGEHRDAFGVAREGVARWPRAQRIWRELYLSRTRCVDWERALVGTEGTAAPEPEATDPCARVTEPGFLSGREGPLEGVIEGQSGPRDVRLFVNGHLVATTVASSAGAEGPAVFSLNCAELMTYLGDGDVVELRRGDLLVPVVGRGRRCVVATGYDSRFAALRQRLEAGDVFTKFGALHRGHTPERKAQTLALFDEVADLVRDELGYESFPLYGNLLGAVREHDLIAHDVGGFDMAYLSDRATPDEVRAEFMTMCRALLRRGYRLTLEPWSAYVASRTQEGIFIDLNYAWVDRSGRLGLSFGWRHDPVDDVELVRYPRHAPIAGQLVRVPGNAEAVLDQIYGPGWLTPDQGFRVADGIVRDPRYLLDEPSMRALEAEEPDRVRALVERFEDGSVTGATT